MEYNQDECLLRYNTFGDSFSLWRDGDRLVTVDLDGPGLRLSHKPSITGEQAQEFMIRALANRVMHLERKAELLREEIADMDADIRLLKEQR